MAKHQLSFTFEEMQARAQEAQWVDELFFKRHFRRHKNDWDDMIPSPLTVEEYEGLRKAAIGDTRVRLFVYLHNGQPQWGFFCENLHFAGRTFENVAVVYDLKGDFITNCHRALAGLIYFLGKDKVRELKRGEVWT